jgi:hypothetical protein
MSIILFTLKFVFNLFGKILLLFSVGTLFAGFGYVLLSISKIAIDMIYDIYVHIKQHQYVYKNLLYIILFIDIITIILNEIQTIFLKNNVLHI